MKKTKRTLAWLLSLALMLSLLPALALPAAAGEIGNGTTAWDEDMTVASNAVVIDGNVTVTSGITVTIPEGKTLTVNGTITVGDGTGTLTVNGGGTLTVTGKAGAEGAYNPTGDGGAAGDGSPGVKGSLIVDGPAVTVNGGAGGRGGNTGVDNSYSSSVVIGGNGGVGGQGVTGSVTLRSGSLTVSGGKGGDGGGMAGNPEENDKLFCGKGNRGGQAVGGNATISGGTLVLHGGDGGDGDEHVPLGFGGMACNAVTVSGGTATLCGGAAGNDAAGGDACTDATVSGGALTLNAGAGGGGVGNGSAGRTFLGTLTNDTGGALIAANGEGAVQHTYTGTTFQPDDEGSTGADFAAEINGLTLRPPTAWEALKADLTAGKKTVTLKGDAECPAGEGLTVPDGTTLTIPADMTLSVSGTVTVGENGTGSFTVKGAGALHVSAESGEQEDEDGGDAVRGSLTVDMAGDGVVVLNGGDGVAADNGSAGGCGLVGNLTVKGGEVYVYGGAGGWGDNGGSGGAGGDAVRGNVTLSGGELMLSAGDGGGNWIDGNPLGADGKTFTGTLTNGSEDGRALFAANGNGKAQEYPADKTLSTDEIRGEIDGLTLCFGRCVTVTAGEGMTRKESSGAATQDVFPGEAMTAVVYEAAEGYYFPTGYSINAVNGVSVTRNSDTQITVSGTPTADAELTLPAATQMGQVATPAFSPAAGAVEAGTTVTISCGTAGATIRYTTDGTDPTATSDVYDGAYTVNADVTIKAIAFKDGMKPSAVATASYTIRTEPVTVKYSVTVTNGTADKESAAAGETVTITADPAPEGMVFDKWANITGTSDIEVTLEDTAFTMPASDVTATATYRDIQVEKYLVTVVNGTGGGTFAAGETVTVTAAAAPTGQVFDKWTSGDVLLGEGATSETLSFLMPANDVTVTATYKYDQSSAYDDWGDWGDPEPAVAPVKTEETPVAAFTPVKIEGTPHVVLSPQRFTVNGVELNLQAYNINGTNFISIRDLAAILRGTPAQFNVEYNASMNQVVITTGQTYAGDVQTDFVDESASAVPSPQSICVNGQVIDLTAFNIGGKNYFSVRELAEVMGFGVDYDPATNTAIITSK